MFPSTNGKRNSRDGEDFALLARSNAEEGAGSGRGGGGGGPPDDLPHLDTIEMDGSLRNGEFM